MATHARMDIICYNVRILIDSNAWKITTTASYGLMVIYILFYQLATIPAYGSLAIVILVADIIAKRTQQLRGIARTAAPTTGDQAPFRADTMLDILARRLIPDESVYEPC
jgi:hypothetical protein